MKRLTTMVILIQVLFISCHKEDIEDKEPGFFVLTELVSSSKGSTATTRFKSGQAGYDLGELKSSREYSFILANGGDEPIFDIVLSSDNAAFQISPEEISYMENGQFGNTTSSGIIPIISLGVIHGMQINGVGFTDLLPPGVNTSTIKIKGKTTENNQTINISSEFDFSVDAKIMDVKLYVDGLEFDITENYGGISTTLGGLGFMRHYQINSPNLEIENTGNVDINLTIGYGSESYTKRLVPTKKIPIEISGPTFFRLESNGTITDNNRIQLGNDGIGYFAMTN